MFSNVVVLDGDDTEEMKLEMVRTNLNKAAFVSNLEQKIDGVYIFYLDGCGPCEKYNKILEGVKSKKKVFNVECSGDLNYFISLGMAQMPETRVYENGQVTIKIKGVPKKEDLGKLFGV